ncbi:J domain-containing protein [Streptomyces sp. NPDC101160]|uniref:J domain-containing protein n=1 Tax=Streptomyces sp. NPDC101160 TaxID=3366118 RepID=UPI00382F72DE
MTAPRRPDFYAVLGVDPTASVKQITSAYRTLVRALHPDAHPEQRAQPEELDEVMTAYATLRDARKRAEYDRHRTAGFPHGAAMPAAAVPVRHTGRPARPSAQAAYVVVVGPVSTPEHRDPWLEVGPVRIGF